MDTLIVITGPTAVGKTEVAIQLAETLHCHIVSADSRQLYREMPIGTAAPTPHELSRVPHHLVACRSVLNPLNAYDYEQQALAALHNAFPQGHGFAILSGGSMMYVNALCHGIDPMPDIPSALRQSLKDDLNTHGLDHMVARLRQLDPVYCQSADLRNPRRVLHALELCLVTNGPASALRHGQPHPRPFRILKFALMRPRDELYSRIDSRVDTMLHDGLINEARSLYHLPHDLPTLNTVGYRELFAAFNNEIPLPEAIRLIKRNTRHYAKKQITWINADPDYSQLHPSNALKNILPTILP